MTLHEAIEKVLRQTGHSMTAREIADKLNSSNMYSKGDDSEIATSQISFGRYELEEYLIKKYRPLLNRKGNKDS